MMIKGGKPRQQQLLGLLLEVKSGLSLDDMAQRLAISRNAVKQHVDVLESKGLICKAQLNQTGGRPVQIYILAEAGINAFPKQYSWFGNLVLSDLKAEMGEAAFKRYMAKLGRQLAETLRAEFEAKPLADQLIHLVTVMQSLGYQAELDNSVEPPAIIAFNCVYHDLTQQHPELCEFDHALISTLLAKPIEQSDCMARQDCVCKFLLKK